MADAVGMQVFGARKVGAVGCQAIRPRLVTTASVLDRLAATRFRSMAGQQRLSRDLSLDHKIGRHGDRLHLLVGQHGLVVGVQLGDAKTSLDLVPQLPAQLGQRDQLAAGDGEQVGKVYLLGHKATADIAKSNGHRPFPPVDVGQGSG